MDGRTACFSAAVLTLLLLAAVLPAAESARVRARRVPDGGIQPQAAVDEKGAVHLIYYRGDPGGGDLFYTRSADGGSTFSPPLRVNTHAASALSAGNIRGAHLALGKAGRPHVAWMGTGKNGPKGPGGSSPMLYTRLDDSGTAFEEERNVIQMSPGLDGGGSLAADSKGNVYVTWHAPEAGKKGEEHRRVWVALSQDEGKTFAREKPAFAEATGACACCGMRAFADRSGALHILYRSAYKVVHRDMYLLNSRGKGGAFRAIKLDEWEVGTCVMSSAVFAQGPSGALAAWENKGQIYWTRIDPKDLKPARQLAAPGDAKGRKHPAIAAGDRGEVLLVWTEGMGWNRGGAAAWQLFDAGGKPIAGESGRVDGVPVWSLVAAFTAGDGVFTIIY
jgi:hypothetical protein